MTDPPPSPRVETSNESLIIAEASGQLKNDSSRRLEDREPGPKGSDPDGNYDSEEDGDSSDDDGSSDDDNDDDDNSTSSEQSSTHGESINPTRQDSYENLENLAMGGGGYSTDGDDDDDENDDYYANEGGLEQHLNNNNNRVKPNKNPQSYDSRMSYDSIMDDDDDGTDDNNDDDDIFADEDTNNYKQNDHDEETGVGAGAGAAKQQPSSGPRYSTFPSNRCLISMVVLLVLACGVFIGFLTWFLWERNRLDPIVPPGKTPTDVGAPQPGKPPVTIPTDKELLKLFSGYGFGNDVNNPTTNAGKAAQWMINEDPGKNDLALLPRSTQGWIQRYILAYTYFSTTSPEGSTTDTTTTTTEWLSCNPPADGASEACDFSYPTELPNGQIVYDLVPSYRWLSGADECLWGGVACGTTVIDKDDEKNNIYRSAVTSIVLADQNLRGSIVTELLDLPHLQTLDLSHNGLEGRITQEFGKLTKVNLSHNKIAGTIPASLVEDASSPLEDLDLGHNELVGRIPASIGRSTSLKYLSLENNDFIGSIPLLGNMPLEVFHGQNNRLEGILPFDYGYDGTWPSTLKKWWVHNNAIGGDFPQGIGYLTNLEDFRVGNNQISGTIPNSIGSLNRLFRFDVQVNRLVGTIPESMGTLQSLQDVKFQFNGLTGSVPTDICFLETMDTLQANCFFGDDFAETARQFEAAQARQEAKIEASKNTEVIPVASSIEEALEAAKSGVVPFTRPPEAPKPQPPPRFDGYADVLCYCCTQCCNPDTGECLTFSTNEITYYSGLTSDSSAAQVMKKRNSLSTLSDVQQSEEEEVDYVVEVNDIQV